MTTIDTIQVDFKINADEAVKATQKIDKATKETKKNFKETNEEAKSFGSEFSRLIENGVAAAGAYAGASALRSGLNFAQDYNKTLINTAELVGLNAQALDSMAKAAEAAGGSATGAISNLGAIAEAQAMYGRQSNVLGQADFYHKEAQEKRAAGMNEASISQFLKQAGGYSDVGLINLIKGDDARYQRFKQDFKSKLTDEQIKANRQRTEIDTKTEQGLINWFSALGATLSTAWTMGGEFIAGLLNTSAQSNAVVGTEAVAGVALGGLGLAGAAKVLKGFKATSALKVIKNPWVLGTIATLAGGAYLYNKYKDHKSNGASGTWDEAGDNDSLDNYGGVLGHMKPKNGGADLDDGTTPEFFGDKKLPPMLKKAKESLSTISSTPVFSSGNTSINIDKIDINTAATDARGIANDIKTSLYSALSNLGANFSDGVQK